MMNYPDESAYRERVRQAMLNDDEAAMGRALDDYATEVARSGQILELYKEGMIRKAREYLHEMFKALDAKRDQGSSS